MYQVTLSNKSHWGDRFKRRVEISEWLEHNQFYRVHDKIELCGIRRKACMVKHGTPRPDDGWGGDIDYYTFQRASDAILFKLVWGGE